MSRLVGVSNIRGGGLLLSDNYHSNINPSGILQREDTNHDRSDKSSADLIIVDDPDIVQVLKLGLLTSIRFGYFRVTDRGTKVLDQNPHKIDNVLKQFLEY
jgi:hypothetical protein